MRGSAVFLTLRDPVAAVSVRVICSRQVFDAAEPPPADGARVVILARPDFNANRGSFALTALEIRAVGRGRAAGPAGTAAPPAGLGGAFFARTEAADPLPARCHRPDLRTRFRGAAGRPAERRAALARRPVPRGADGGAGIVRGRGGHRRAAAPRRGPRGRRDRDRPRRRLARGPAPVLRRGAGPGGGGVPDAGGERDRARAGHAAARLRGRPARVHADGRGQAGRARRRRAGRAHRPAARPGPPVRDRLARPRDGLAGGGSGPGPRWPTRCGRSSARPSGWTRCCSGPGCR